MYVRVTVRQVACNLSWSSDIGIKCHLHTFYRIHEEERESRRLFFTKVMSLHLSSLMTEDKCSFFFSTPENIHIHTGHNPPIEATMNKLYFQSLILFSFIVIMFILHFFFNSSRSSPSFSHPQSAISSFICRTSSHSVTTCFVLLGQNPFYHRQTDVFSLFSIDTRHIDKTTFHHWSLHDQSDDHSCLSSHHIWHRHIPRFVVLSFALEHTSFIFLIIFFPFCTPSLPLSFPF